MSQVKSHARDHHGITTMDTALIDKVRGSIRDLKEDKGIEAA